MASSSAAETVTPWSVFSTERVAPAAGAPVVTPWARQVLAALGEDGLGGGGIETGGTGGGASSLSSLLLDYPSLMGAYSAYDSDMSASSFASSIGAGAASALCGLADVVESVSSSFAGWLRSLCAWAGGTGGGGGEEQGEYTVASLVGDYPDLSALNDLYQQGYSPADAATAVSGWGIAGPLCSIVSIVAAVGITALSKGRAAGKAAAFFDWAEKVCGVVGDLASAVDAGSGETQVSVCPPGYVFDTSQGECVWQGDSDAGDYGVTSFLADFPGLDGAYSAYASGQTADQAAAGLVAAGILTPICVAVSTVLTVGLGVIARGIPSSALKGFLAFLTAVCAAVGANAATSPEQPPQNPCDNPAASCGEGMVWDAWFCRCIAQHFSVPCAKGLGFVDTEGNCIPCPLGHRYDSAQEMCVEGCPEGWEPNARYGCVDPSYNKACDWNGKKGVVTPDGECTADGCPAGQKWDFDTEACVPSGGTTAVGGVPIKNNVPPKGGTTTKPVEIKADEAPAKKTSWGLWLGLAMVAGAAGLLLKSKQAEAAGDTDQTDASDAGDDEEESP